MGNDQKKGIKSEVVKSVSVLNTPENKDELVLPKTKFTYPEYFLLKEIFKSICISTDNEEENQINKFKISHIFFPEKKPETFKPEELKILNSIFVSLNENGDANLSWYEFVIGMSVALRGTYEEQTQLAFKIYNYDLCDDLSKSEMISILKSLKSLDILDPSDMNIEESVDIFFDKKNMLNFEGFKESSKSNSLFANGCGIFHNIFGKVFHPINKFLNTKNHLLKEGEVKIETKSYHCLFESGIFKVFENKSKQKELPNKFIVLSNIKSIKYVKNNQKAFYVVMNDSNKYYLEFKDEIDRMNWGFCFCLYIFNKKSYRFESTFPEREFTKAKWFCDGESAFYDMAYAMNHAKEEIFIVDWGLSIFLYLVRDGESTKVEDSRLDRILLKKAKAGVKIRVLIYDDPNLSGLNLKSDFMINLLTNLHPLITCINHPPNFQYYSHHQKCVVVDRKIAFVGGLDFFYGRWDNANHLLTDSNHLSLCHVGMDYYNPSRGKFPAQSNSLDGYQDWVDRDNSPRLPWEDIHSSVVGSRIVKDIVFNFVERWNNHVSKHKNKIYLEVEPIEENDKEIAKNDYEYLLPPNDWRLNMKCQFVRSIEPWSGGARLEKSIYEGYKELINNAQHYIYIENQFFISSTNYMITHVQNEIAQLILDKIFWAIENNKKFKVIIIVPVNSEGGLKGNVGQQIAKYQYKTIFFQKASMLEVIKSTFPNVDPRDYISFHYLRNYGFCYDNRPITEFIYVHAKLMIVDDKFAIIGSANLNDRSLLGSRDSEMAIIFEDKEFIKGKIDGKEVEVGKFCSTLRKRLLIEHLTNVDLSFDKNEVEFDLEKKIKKNKIRTRFDQNFEKSKEKKFSFNFEKVKKDLSINEKFDLDFFDPIKNYDYILKVSDENTKIYKEVFGDIIPDEKFLTFKEYLEKKKIEESKWDNLTVKEQENEFENAKKKLEKVKGFICSYPIYWVKKEPYTKDVTLGMLFDDNLFT